MSQVHLQDVIKNYGDVSVLKGVNLSIDDHQFVSFLGPSGCGKTTCLRLIAGLEPLSSGSITIGERVVNDVANKIFVAPEHRRLGMVFQSYAVWPHMNVFDNVAFPLKIKHKKKDEMIAEVNSILRIVELDGLSKRMPNELSGGQQQRVALARGLVARPEVLLLDEPLSNLDAKLREKMRHDVRQIQQQFKITCVYVTHDQIEAFSMSDKIVILDKGMPVQIGTPSEIRSAPKNEWVSDFIKSH